MKFKSYYAIWLSVTNLLQAFSGITINIIFNTQIFPFSKLIETLLVFPYLQLVPMFISVFQIILTFITN